MHAAVCWFVEGELTSFVAVALGEQPRFEAFQKRTFLRTTLIESLQGRSKCSDAAMLELRHVCV